jgi:hypothetical protein
VVQFLSNNVEGDVEMFEEAVSSRVVSGVSARVMFVKCHRMGDDK